jgi:hypothetical protein
MVEGLETISGSWQEWLTVAGYLGFTGVIAWRVLFSDRKQ